MATKMKTKAKAKGKGKATNLPKYEAPEFGIEALAKEMDIEPATVRVKLRGAEVKKDGRSYDFKNAAGVKAMAKKLAA